MTVKSSVKPSVAQSRATKAFIVSTRIGRGGLMLALAAAAAGCTWVKPTGDAESVTLEQTPGQVSSCTLKGRAAVETLNSILFIPRSRDKVKQELVTLARNEAVVLRGNTIVPEGPVDKGSQSFKVYYCQR